MEGKQPRRGALDQPVKLNLQDLDLVGELRVAAGEAVHREHSRAAVAGSVASPMADRRTQASTRAAAERIASCSRNWAGAAASRELVDGHGAGADGAGAHGVQRADGFHGAIAGLRGSAGASGKNGLGGGVGVDWVGLSLAASGFAVGPPTATTPATPTDHWPYSASPNDFAGALPSTR